MIIGISGAQGQGKSTLIKALIEGDDNGFGTPNNLQTSRKVLSEWGYSLAEVNTFMPLKIKFQEKLLERHIKALEGFTNMGDTAVLVERTFADIFAYALLSLGPFNVHSDWLNSYAESCSWAQQKYFDGVVFLSGRTYVPEDDGVRSTNEHFANVADYLIHHYTVEFGKTIKTRELSSPHIEDRVKYVQGMVQHMTTPDLVGRIKTGI